MSTTAWIITASVFVGGLLGLFTRWLAVCIGETLLVVLMVVTAPWVRPTLAEFMLRITIGVICLNVGFFITGMLTAWWRSAAPTRRQP